MTQKRALKDRVGLIDEIRGLSILLMIGYHLGYDLTYLFHLPIPLFESPMLDFARDFFAGVFIFISGICCRLSRSNLKRGILCLGSALLLTLFTALFLPEEVIRFGILHLLGSAMILFSLFRPLLNRLSSASVGTILFGFLFLLLYRVPMGTLGWIDLPNDLYASNLFPLGFPRADFFSADYFPLVPWLFLFLAGSYFGILVVNHKLPRWIYTVHCPFLAAVGRHTLIIYLIHQPILYGLLTMIAQKGFL